MLLYGALVPHPPIIIKEIGGRETEKASSTVSAMSRLAERIAELAPETVLIFSPHGPVFRDGLAIRGGERLRGDLRRFGSSLSWEWENDRELVFSIIEEARKEGVPCLAITEEGAIEYRIPGELDHGVLVPLSFIAHIPFCLAATGMSLLPWHQQYALGVAIARAVKKSPKRIVVLASGDLSHCLIPGAPSPYDPRGREFDDLLVKLLRKNNPEEFFNLSPVLVEKAAECGFRTLLMLLGVFEGLKTEVEIYSYEGPFGVGYAVAGITPGPEAPERIIFPLLLDRRRGEITARRAQESPLVRLARLTVENHLRGRGPVAFTETSPEYRRKAGAFVSIKKHGDLRGCIGTIFPTQPTLVEEVKSNAIAAAFHDPRFDPVAEDELEELTYSVDVLEPPEPVRGIEDLDPKEYGVIVRRGRRSGLLLPNLEGVETAEEQVRIARRKAGIREGEEVELERFKVTRYY